MDKTGRMLLWVLLASFVLSFAVASATSVYRSRHFHAQTAAEYKAESPLYSPFAPFNVINPSYTWNEGTATNTEAYSVDYAAAIGNALYAFVPLAIICLATTRLTRSARQR